LSFTLHYDLGKDEGFRNKHGKPLMPEKLLYLTSEKVQLPLSHSKRGHTLIACDGTYHQYK